MLAEAARQASVVAKHGRSYIIQHLTHSRADECLSPRRETFYSWVLERQLAGPGAKSAKAASRRPARKMRPMTAGRGRVDVVLWAALVSALLLSGVGVNAQVRDPNYCVG